MRTHLSAKVGIFLSAIVSLQLIVPPLAYLKAISPSKRLFINSTIRPQQSSKLRILDPNGDPNPVVNEKGQIQLNVVDEAGQRVSDASFSSGSPEVATVDPNTGMVIGKEQGFTTI